MLELYPSQTGVTDWIFLSQTLTLLKGSLSLTVFGKQRSCDALRKLPNAYKQ